MTYDQVLSIIERFGFPAAVAGFVLIRLDRQLQKLTSAVVSLLAEIRAERQGGYSPPRPTDAF